MVTAAPALVEAYAVLTRLPPPYRLSPEDSLVLLEGSFIKGTRVIALQVGSYQNLLRQAPKNGVAGIWTHATDGLSENGFILAAKIEALK